ncbi:MAG: glutathione S-transferase family protein [Gemmatimonas sp.]
MKLYNTPTSPYGRKVLITSIEKGLDKKMEVLPARTPEAELHKKNPLDKLPVLVTDEGEVIIESSLICEYLDEIGSGAKLIPDEKRMRRRIIQAQAVAQGVLDAVVLLRMEDRRTPELRSKEWIERQQKKVDRGVPFLEGLLQNIGAGPTLAHITFACCLWFMEKHGIGAGWRTTAPRLAAWYDEFKKRPSFAATEPA